MTGLLYDPIALKPRKPHRRLIKVSQIYQNIMLVTECSDIGGKHASLYQGVAEQDGFHHHARRPGHLDLLQHRDGTPGLPGMA